MSKKLHDPGARLIETSYCPTTCFCYFAVLSNCSCCAGVSCRLGSYRHPTFLQLVLLLCFYPSIFSVSSFSCCAGEPWWTDSYGHPTVLQHLHDEYAATDHRPHRPDPGLPHASLQPHPWTGVLWPERNNRLAPLIFVSLDIHTKWETFCKEPFSLQLMYCNHITLTSNHFTAPFVLHPVLLSGIHVDGFAHF